MPTLGVNIDHVATIRQARQTIEPDPVWAAVLAELGGADGITVHLREDRRHIQDRDIEVLTKTVKVPINMEMAAVDEMTKIATRIKPYKVTLVPEKREEITTEGGLDVVGNAERVEKCVRELQKAGIVISLFIDPDEKQIVASKEMGAESVELHTGRYADAETPGEQDRELGVLIHAADIAVRNDLELHMGHGLTYRNVTRIASIPHVQELNIGHSIISRAVMVGFERAVREMKNLINP